MGERLGDTAAATGSAFPKSPNLVIIPPYSRSLMAGIKAVKPMCSLDRGGSGWADLLHILGSSIVCRSVVR